MMDIRSSQDRVLVEACCPCGLPECPPPELEYQSLDGFGKLAWESYNSVTNTFYQTYRTNYSGGGFRQRRQSQPFSAWFDVLPGGAVSMAVQELTEAPPWTGTASIVRLEPIDVAAARAAAEAALTGAIAWDVPDFSYEAKAMSSRSVVEPDFWTDTVIRLTWARYRIGVPADFSTPEAPRTRFEVEWDEVQASEEWWAWHDGGEVGEAPAPGAAVVAARSWAWDGDGGNLWSGWHDLPPPGSVGVVRVVNMTVKCWASARLGVVPTAHGDVVAV